jgi:hypothetical protein
MKLGKNEQKIYFTVNIICSYFSISFSSFLLKRIFKLFKLFKFVNDLRHK